VTVVVNIVAHCEADEADGKLPHALAFEHMPREHEWVSIDFRLFVVEAVHHKFLEGGCETFLRLSRFKPT
jgi:hypothetical protein